MATFSMTFQLSIALTNDSDSQNVCVATIDNSAARPREIVTADVIASNGCHATGKINPDGNVIIYSFGGLDIPVGNHIRMSAVYPTKKTFSTSSSPLG